MIDAIELARGQLEPWQADHKTAMACRDLEDHLQVGIRAYRFIRSLDEGWSRTVQEGKSPFEAKFAQALRDLYDLWLRPCEDAMARIRAIELDFEVKGAGEFITAYRTVRALVRVPVQELIDAATEVQASKAA